MAQRKGTKSGGDGGSTGDTAGGGTGRDMGPGTGARGFIPKAGPGLGAASPVMVAGPGRSFINIPGMRHAVPLGPAVPSVSEVAMFDIGQVMADKNFASLDEANRELRKMIMRGPIPRSEPPDGEARAQRLAYDAYEDLSFGEDGLRLADQALAFHPDCADAYLYKAMALEMDDVAKAVVLGRQAVEAGERALGQDWLEESSGELWGHIEARPLLRSYLFLARTLWDLGSRLNAVVYLEDALDFDGKEDGLGLRYLLLSWYLDMGEEMRSSLLLDRYKREKSAVWLYGDALLKYWMRGEDRTSLARARKALKANPHVAALLLGDGCGRPPDPRTYAYGDESEAWFCTELLVGAWEREGDALEWLDEVRKRPVSQKRRPR